MLRRIFILAVFTMILCGCTANQRARQFGCSEVIKLDKGQKFVNATWKDKDIWYITRPMKEGEQPEKYTFQEKSSFGIVQGKVIFEESR